MPFHVNSKWSPGRWVLWQLSDLRVFPYKYSMLFEVEWSWAPKHIEFTSYFSAEGWPNMQDLISICKIDSTSSVVLYIILPVSHLAC